MPGLGKYIRQQGENCFRSILRNRQKSWLAALFDYCLRRLPLTAIIYGFRAGFLVEVSKAAQSRTKISILEQRTLARSQAMLSILEQGLKLPKTSHRSPTYNQFNHRVLLNFHSCGNFDHAGYSVRSLSLLNALKRRNIEVTACTRLGYPWDLPKHRDKEVTSSSLDQGLYFHHFHDKLRLLGKPETRYIEAYTKVLMRLAQKQEVSIIHASSNYLNGLAAAQAAQRLGIKSVYEMRGLWHMTRATFEPGYAETEHFRYCELMELSAAKLCNSVVTISAALAKRLERAGVDQQKIRIIGNAADFGTEPARVMELDQTKNSFTLGFIGSLTVYEGLDLIIRAVAGLRKEIPGIKCLIVGDGPERKNLERLSCQLSSQKVIRFLGQVKPEQVNGLYQMIDICPLPRKAYPICRLIPPLKPFEIMAAAKPLIVSNLIPLLEIVKDRETGLVCRANDSNSLKESVRFLYRHPEEAKRIALNGQKWARSHTWSENGRLYDELYHSLYETKSTP